MSVPDARIAPKEIISDVLYEFFKRDGPITVRGEGQFHCKPCMNEWEHEMVEYLVAVAEHENAETKEKEYKVSIHQKHEECFECHKLIKPKKMK